LLPKNKTRRSGLLVGNVTQYKLKRTSNLQLMTHTFSFTYRKSRLLVEGLKKKTTATDEMIVTATYNEGSKPELVSAMYKDQCMINFLTTFAPEVLKDIAKQADKLQGSKNSLKIAFVK
jgi:hypothetical protein